MAVTFDHWDGLSGGMSDPVERPEAEITEDQRARWVKRKSHLITEVIKCSIFKAVVDGHTCLEVDKTTSEWADGFLPNWDFTVAKILKDQGYQVTVHMDSRTLRILWS